MKKQCAAVVWKKDTYRRTGRTPSGFEMHFSKERCSRLAKVGELCTQHSRMNVLTWKSRW